MLVAHIFFSEKENYQINVDKRQCHTSKCQTSMSTTDHVLADFLFWTSILHYLFLLMTLCICASNEKVSFVISWSITIFINACGTHFFFSETENYKINVDKRQCHTSKCQTSMSTTDHVLAHFLFWTSILHYLFLLMTLTFFRCSVDI